MDSNHVACVQITMAEDFGVLNPTDHTAESGSFGLPAAVRRPASVSTQSGCARMTAA